MTSSYRTLLDFQAHVNAKDFQAAINGDEEAINRIRNELNNVDLYFHIGPTCPKDHIWVTVADLIAHQLVLRITLHKDD